MPQTCLKNKNPIKREHISNIELGKNSPAVKIITDIARALDRTFEIDGCRIEPTPDGVLYGGPISLPQQMVFEFGVEHRFAAASLTLTSTEDDMVEVRAVFSRRRGA